MRIAYTKAPGRGDTDLLLARFAAALMARGVRLAGTVQINSDPPCDGPCDMDVRVLPDGPVIRISQSLGPGARGCRLDPGALQGAVAHVEDAMRRGFDLMIINKFGKHEASGQGFRDVIAEAVAQDIPVLVGASSLNAEAFQSFAGGLAQAVEPDLDALLAWAEAALPAGLRRRA